MTNFECNKNKEASASFLIFIKPQKRLEAKIEKFKYLTQSLLLHDLKQLRFDMFLHLHYQQNVF
jgi:hypothetical protein